MGRARGWGGVASPEETWSLQRGGRSSVPTGHVVPKQLFLLWSEPLGSDSDTLLGTAWPSERNIWWPTGIRRGQHLGTEVPHEHPPPWQCMPLRRSLNLGPARSCLPGSQGPRGQHSGLWLRVTVGKGMDAGLWVTTQRGQGPVGRAQYTQLTGTHWGSVRSFSMAAWSPRKVLSRLQLTRLRSK